MDFEQVIRRRRMVRAYASGPVSPRQLRRILEAASKAPSAGFAQGQSLVVITDEDVRAQIAALAGEASYRDRGFDPWISAAPVLLVLCTSETPYLERYSAADKTASAPPSRWPIPYRYLDAGCTMMLALMAAVDEGLSAGFMGAHALPGLGGLLGIPGDVEPLGLITIGKPAASTRGSRWPRRDAVHWQRWGGKA